MSIQNAPLHKLQEWKLPVFHLDGFMGLHTKDQLQTACIKKVWGMGLWKWMGCLLSLKIMSDFILRRANRPDLLMAWCPVEKVGWTLSQSSQTTFISTPPFTINFLHSSHHNASSLQATTQPRKHFFLTNCGTERMRKCYMSVLKYRNPRSECD